MKRSNSLNDTKYPKHTASVDHLVVLVCGRTPSRKETSQTRSILTNREGMTSVLQMTLANLFYEISIVPITRPDKDLTKKKIRKLQVIILGQGHR